MVNECDTAHCENNGQCVDKINGYECICRDEFTGLHCDRGKLLLQVINKNLIRSETACDEIKTLMIMGTYEVSVNMK